MLHPLFALYAQTFLLVSRQTPCLEDAHQILQAVIACCKVFLAVLDGNAAIAFFLHAASVAELRHPGSHVVAVRVVVEGLLDWVEDSGFAAWVVADASTTIKDKSALVRGV